jgi:WD40 repeat protein
MKRLRFLQWIVISWTMWLLNTLFVSAQIREAWLTEYPEEGAFFTYLFASVLDHQGNPVVTGISDLDYLTIKYDKRTGQIVWIARYDHGDQDYGQAIAMDANGDVLVTGFSRGTNTGSDYATVKYDDQTGQQLWVARYNGPGNGSDIAYALTVDTQGNVFVTGSSVGLGTNSDYATVKYDGQTGQELWVARYATPVNEYANAIAIDQRGNVFVTGRAGTIKYDGQTGQTLWGPKPDDSRAIAIDGQGDVLVTGSSSTGSGYVTIKYDGQTGQQLWRAIADIPGGIGEELAVDPVGNVYITGGYDYNNRCLVIKYSGQNGAMLWSQSLRNGFNALALDQEGDVYTTGPSRITFPGPVGDFRTVKFDGRTGRLLWQRTYPNANGRAIIVDANRNLYVSGFLGPDDTRLERYLTIKYEQSPPGDVNYDFCVDDEDLLRVLDTFGQSGNLPEDVNRDGVVDDQDLLTVLFNFGRGCGEE